MTTATLDTLVSDPRLDPAARAVLLLRSCLLAQVLRPDILQRYWEPLKACANQIPASSREAFEGLRDTLEPPSPDSLGGFARKVADAVTEAKSAPDHDAALATLREWEHKIQARPWPFGKRQAWDTLVRGWIDVDRVDGLRHVDHLPRATQANVLIRENDRAALDSGVWDFVDTKVPRAARAAIDELLEREDPHLDLSAAVADAVALMLLKEMFKGSADDRDAESKRDAAKNHYEKLFKTAVELSGPNAAARLLARWLTTTAETPFYDQQWLSRFFALFRIVRVWSAYPAIEPKLAPFVMSKVPAHLRDAVIVYAAALKPTTAEEADAAWRAIEPQLTDKASAEHWFLLTLLRSGLPEHALAMAGTSPHAADIVPCLRRAWLYEHADSARAVIRPKHVAGDEIAEFLLLDRDARVEFLRGQTQNGDRSMPTVMWRPPNILDLDIRQVGGGSFSEGAAVGTWYTKTEPKEKQFAALVRIHGYGKHLYENLDPILLETFVAWDEVHPDETEAVLRRMWVAMRNMIKPSIRLDLVRNDIMDRCQSVLSARPAILEEYVRWCHEELTKKAYTETVGTTTYTFQLNERAPFLYALLAAQKVARVSAKRCDDILTYAIRTHIASDELLTAAAALYASDKGMAGLEPPAPLLKPGQRKAWQLGVLEAALKEVLAAVAEAGPGAA